MKNRYCPKCHHVLIIELQINDKTMKSRLHAYCEKCGYDIELDPFHTKYREYMTSFITIIKKKKPLH